MELLRARINPILLFIEDHSAIRRCGFCKVPDSTIRFDVEPSCNRLPRGLVKDFPLHRNLFQRSPNRLDPIEFGVDIATLIER